MTKIIFSVLISAITFKNVIKTVFVGAGIVATEISSAQFNNGGNVVNMGFLYPSVTDLSLIPSPRPVGLQVICLCDSMAHIWDGTTWHVNLDSARIARIGYIKRNDISAGTGISYNSSTGVISNSVISNLNVYDKTGLLATNAKLFTDTFSVTTATPTISMATYLSAMGASNFRLISASGYRSGATTGTSPNVSVTAITSNSVTLLFNQTNTSTVTILGISVLSGLPTILVPDPTNVKAVLSFYAW